MRRRGMRLKLADMARRITMAQLLSICPYGGPGDVLVLLTTWATLAAHDGLKPSELPADAPVSTG